MRWRALVACLSLGVLAACQGATDGGAASSPPSSTDSGDSSAALTVMTDSGEVRGVLRDGDRTWAGIPYAAPPVGNLRWRPPQPAAAWTGVRAAAHFAPACVQPDVVYSAGTAHLPARPGTSEDCLHLNVLRPDDDRVGLPVMVWLHGGAFVGGSGSDPTYVSTPITQRGIITVSVDYRLGRLGFFAHPALGGDVANFGLLDQEAALRWVQRNIAAFGGDPKAVTVAGSSAGGMSVNALMVAPGARGLFQRAISQSGLGDEEPRTLASARQQGERTFPGLSAAQLRALPAADLLSGTFSIFTGDAPIIDSVLPERVADGFAAGDEAPVPYLVGSTSDEFSDGAWQGLGVDPGAIRATYGGARHDAIVADYGASAYDHDLVNDLVFSGPALRLAAEHARRAPTYRYRFGVDPAGSTHGSELSYVFDTLGADDNSTQGRLSAQVADYWAAFIRSGSPQVDGLPTWPATGDGTALLDFTPTGPEPLAADPWAARLALSAP